MERGVRVPDYIVRVAEIDGGRTSWIDNGELVRCESCVNWGAMGDIYPPDHCPVVRKCTRPTDWCCWGARKEDVR